MQMDMSDEYKRKQIKSEIYIWLVALTSTPSQFSSENRRGREKKGSKENANNKNIGLHDHVGCIEYCVHHFPPTLLFIVHEFVLGP